jgi:hypothetical protein
MKHGADAPRKFGDDAVTTMRKDMMLTGRAARAMRGACALGVIALIAVALSACTPQSQSDASSLRPRGAEARAIDLVNVEVAARLIGEACVPAAAGDGLKTLEALAGGSGAETRSSRYPARTVNADRFTAFQADRFLAGVDGDRIQVQAAEAPAGAAGRFDFACYVVVKQAGSYPFEINDALKARTNAAGAVAVEAAAAALGASTSEPSFDIADMAQSDSVRLPSHQIDVPNGRVTYYPAKAPGPGKNIAALVTSQFTQR